AVDYFKVLNLQKEPFANTPDPDMFYPANLHAHCLQKLEIAIRLRRGLCLVTGDVGTGKTTVCRQFFRQLSSDEKFQTHLILDPGFESADDFAAYLNQVLNGQEAALSCSNQSQHKENIQDFLFQSGVKEDKIPVLMIDEGQKLPSACLELLRELLNFETNDYKLLQIIIFAQQEIQEILQQRPNLQDRVALHYELQPLSRKDTANFILYRIRASSADPSQPPRVRFSWSALRLIYKLTQGYPRKIIHLAHHILLSLVMQDKTKVSPGIVRQAVKGTGSSAAPRRPVKTLGLAACAAIALLALGLVFQDLYLDKVQSYLSNSKPVQNKSPEQSNKPSQGSSTYRASVQNKSKQMPNQENQVQLLPTASENEQDNDPKAQEAEDNPEPPKIIGQIQMDNQSTLWSMLEAVYGESDTQTLQAVIKANPWMDSPDIIPAGQKISFPVLSISQSLPEGKNWIRLSKADSLNKAYQQTQNAGLDNFRILALHNPDQGFMFWVVSQDSFQDQASARQALEEMSSQTQQEASVVSLDELEQDWQLVTAE
ncbi:MAG: ExeA family protein, partial [Thermodesulfobacteriota bacterium]